MKLIKQLLSATVLLAALSCSHDSLEGDDAQQLAEGTPLSLPMNLCVSNVTEVQTRAAARLDLHVLIFNESDIFESIEFPGLQSLDGSAILVRNVLATTNKRTIVVLANATEALNSFGSLTGKTLDYVKSKLYSMTSQPQLVPGTTGVYCIHTEPVPVYSGIVVFDKGLTLNSSISSTGTITGDPLALTRNVAQISIRHKTNETVLGLSSATVLNVTSRGLIMKQGEIAPDAKKAYYCPDKKTSLTDAVNFKQRFIADKVQTIGPFTVFETDDVSVLLACKFGLDNTITYHRLAVCDELKNSISLVTNVHYILNITDITGPGYATPEEARDNVPTNQVKYDVVIDDGSHSVSNGESYLSFTSQEFLLCQRTGACKNINIGKLTYKGPAGIGKGKLNVTSDDDWDVTNKTLDNANGAKKSVDLVLSYNGGNIGAYPGTLTFTATYGVLKLETNFHVVTSNDNGWRGDSYTLGAGFKQIALDEECDWAWLSYTVPGSLPTYPPRIVGEVDSTKTIYLLTKLRTSLRQVNFTGVRGNNVVKGRCIQP